jgi:hypothetical protein
MWMLFAIAAVVSVAFGAFAWYEARRSALTDEEHTRVHPYGVTTTTSLRLCDLPWGAHPLLLFLKRTPNIKGASKPRGFDSDT